MLSLKVKDIKKRNQFFKIESKKKALKFVLINLLSKKNYPDLTIGSFIKLNKKINKISKTKIVRRCIFNNRSKSLRVFGISRSILRDMLSSGVFPGFKKAVW